MNNLEFIELLEKVNKRQEEHKEFYDLAEKYGFCFPGCKKCEICEEQVLISK